MIVQKDVSFLNTDPLQKIRPEITKYINAVEESKPGSLLPDEQPASSHQHSGPVKTALAAALPKSSAEDPADLHEVHSANKQLHIAGSLPSEDLSTPDDLDLQAAISAYAGKTSSASYQHEQCLFHRNH